MPTNVALLALTVERVSMFSTRKYIGAHTKQIVHELFANCRYLYFVLLALKLGAAVNTHIVFCHAMFRQR